MARDVPHEQRPRQGLRTCPRPLRAPRTLTLLSHEQKLMQYSIRLALALHFAVTSTRLLRRPTRPPWETGLIKRLTSTADGFSFAR